MAHTNNEGADKTAHARRLVSAFAFRTRTITSFAELHLNVPVQWMMDIQSAVAYICFHGFT